MYTKQYFTDLLASFLRFALAGIGTFFVTNNIGTEGQWSVLILGLAMLIVNAISIVYGRYKGRLNFLAALNARPDTEESVVRAEAEKRANV